MRLIDIALILLNIAVTGYASILLKIGALKKKRLLQLSIIGFGMGVYFAMSFITLYLYSKYNLILIQALLALTYLVTPVFAHLILKERINKKTLVGFATLIVGIIVINLGS